MELHSFLHCILQVICDEIDQTKASKKYGLRLVGLYGVAGIGKTTICQTLCNEYFTKMRGRVFHVELENGRYSEVLQGALKSFSDKSHEFISGLNISQVRWQ